MEWTDADQSNQQAIGRGIRENRERLNRTQEAFAERHGITPRYLQMIEAGERMPSEL
jgi:transcriptional regulator with XRE-family HTH domain